jgi:hypothetical protein
MFFPRNLTRRRRHASGNASLQSVVILAVAALILMSLKLLWASGPDGNGGLMTQLTNKLDTLFNEGEGGTGGPGGGGPGGGGPGGPGGGGGGEQDEDAPNEDAPDDEGPDDGGPDDDDPGDGDPDDGGSGRTDDDRDETEPDDDWESYADIAMAVALETSKEYGQKVIADAKQAALQAVAQNDPLLEAFGMSIKDFHIDDTAGRTAALSAAGLMVDVVVGVDGLIQGEKKVREQAAAGNFRGAWRTTWSTPAKFIADTIFASKAVDVVLKRLPTSVQIAVKVTVPEAIEGAAAAAADALYEPVALNINDKLWELHDRGIVPEPRMPRRN